MKALIVGAGGFVGKYLIDELLAQNDQVTATKLPHEQIDSPCNIRDLNLLDTSAVSAVLQEEKPDCIFHLAAQSSVALSWEKPQLTANINIIGTINLLEAVRNICPGACVLLVGSSEEIGIINQPIPISEEITPHPANIYAVTKATQNMLGNLYAHAYGLNIISVRAFNHIGPGQSSQFVISDFCRQVAEIEAGCREPVLKVGNLEAKRDFTDVRDIVHAYALLVRHGRSGETYHVGSGQAYSIGELLNLILEKSHADITVETDPHKFRPIDVPFICADITKLKQITGFSPAYPIKQSLTDILSFWRNEVQSTRRN